MKNLFFYFYLLKTSIRASITNRNTFLMESALMLANNFIFFSIWWIFFNQFQNINSWDLNDMILLLIVGTGAYGVNQICFGGTKNLSKMIISGELDSFLVQPKNILLHIMGSISRTRGWGHLFSSAILITMGRLYAPEKLMIIFISVMGGALVFAAIGIIAHSLAFWLGPVESLSKKYCDSLFLFAMYPTNIYSGFWQLVMFTLIPAGVIGTLPVDMLRDFSWMKLGLFATTAIFFFILAFVVFYLGLRRYESGNQFSSR